MKGRMGQRIRAARQDRGLTQAQLAAASGIPERTLGGWEERRSDKLPPAKRLRRLAATLGVTVGYLIGEEEAR